jgi:protein-arginine kinase activator protein McsA
MRCFYCNKNEAVKSYEQIKKGVAERTYYCLSCYERLFLYNPGGGEPSLSVCPYCETKAEEFQTQKMVGCAYCYRGMFSKILPTIVQMQGGEVGHRGKKILLSYEGEQILKQEKFLTPEEEDTFRDQLAEGERLKRQKWEMEELISYLGATNPQRSVEYREKLSAMQRTGKVEEEIVW